MMEPWLNMIVTVVCAVLASGGLWTWMDKRNARKDARTQLLVGIAHDRILWLGVQYIDRGYITVDELENISDYLFEPYAKLGGNGSAAKVMEDVKKLPIRKA